MLKIYQIDGKQWQFEEGTQPDGAVELTEHVQPATAPEEKAVKPANKSRKVTNK